MPSIGELIRKDLLEFDGNSLTILGEIEAKYADNNGYVDALIDCAKVSVGQISEGATWLILKRLRDGILLDAEHQSTWLECFESLKGWVAILHFCQSVQFLDLPKQDYDDIFVRLAVLQSSDRPFVRAWAMDAVVRIALAQDRYLEDANIMLSKAHKDQAASVRARARKLQKLIL